MFLKENDIEYPLAVVVPEQGVEYFSGHAFVLKPELLAWCRDNLMGPVYFRPNKDAPPDVMFALEKDALFFKLFWS
jgi:hypothetical protein